MGYPPTIERAMEDEGVEVGDRIKVVKGNEEYEGILMPRTELGDGKNLVLKLDSGYNIGIEFSEEVEVEKLESGDGRETDVDVSELMEVLEDKEGEERPDISILAAGGTIASRVDYRTGAVKPSFTEEEIVSFTPELSSIADIEGRQIFQALSENLTPEHWVRIAEAVKKEIEKKKDGVVIMHGTDTMAYTAAALSFMLEDLPVPVVLVGAQRSSDRGSTDAHQNLTCAVRAATTEIAEVMVCMHGESSDTYCYLHPGTKVRKMHTSRRDAFRTVNEKPFAKVDWETLDVEKLRDGYRTRREDGKLNLKKSFEEDVSLVKAYPGMKPEIFEEQFEESRGVVIEGTGLGHMPLYSDDISQRNERFKELLEDFLQRGGIAFMTSQCLYGRVNMNVYEMGVDLQETGVKGNLNDMLPEVAWVKLGWLLGNYDGEKAEKLMDENLRGEISERTRQEDFYPQGE